MLLKEEAVPDVDRSTFSDQLKERPIAVFNPLFCHFETPLTISQFIEFIFRCLNVKIIQAYFVDVYGTF